MTRRYTHLIANGYEHPFHPPIAATRPRVASTDAFVDAVFTAIDTGRLTPETSVAALLGGMRIDDAIGVEQAAREAGQ